MANFQRNPSLASLMSASLSESRRMESSATAAIPAVKRGKKEEDKAQGVAAPVPGTPNTTGGREELENEIRAGQDQIKSFELSLTAPQTKEQQQLSLLGDIGFTMASLFEINV